MANRLAALACRNRSLPQGGPLSPVLSNYCCRNLDRDLRGLAEEQGLTVSRYADDICFSGNDDSFPAIATGHGRSAVVSTILHELFDKNGFRINERKTNLSIGARRKMVTGLLVGKSVSMPYKWRRQLRALRHIVEKYGESRAQEIVEITFGHPPFPALGGPRMTTIFQQSVTCGHCGTVNKVLVVKYKI